MHSVKTPYDTNFAISFKGFIKPKIRKMLCRAAIVCTNDLFEELRRFQCSVETGTGFGAIVEHLPQDDLDINGSDVYKGLIASMIAVCQRITQKEPFRLASIGEELCFAMIVGKAYTMYEHAVDEVGMSAEEIETFNRLANGMIENDGVLEVYNDGFYHHETSQNLIHKLLGQKNIWFAPKNNRSHPSIFAQDLDIGDPGAIAAHQTASQMPNGIQEDQDPTFPLPHNLIDERFKKSTASPTYAALMWDEQNLEPGFTG
jgi:hypothetical protein